MHYIYHITYSCYDQAMTILLNDKRISNSSSLLQYMGEPFECWCEVLPEILAREVGEDFTFIYTVASYVCISYYGQNNVK